MGMKRPLLRPFLFIQRKIRGHCSLARIDLPGGFPY
jgi:hypothetical protein